MFIDYESNEEFEILLNDIVESYKYMVFDLSSKDLSTMARHERHDLIYNMVLQTDDLWHKFTKGQQAEWCDIHSNALAFMLVNTKLFYDTNQIPLYYEQGFSDFDVNTILSTMVVSYFRGENRISSTLVQNPVFSVEDEVYDDSFVHLVRDFYTKEEPVWLGHVDIPLRKFQQYQLATAMGTHKRLGQVSPLLHLSTDLFKMVWAHVMERD